MIDSRKSRPDLIIETGPGAERFVEE